MPIALLAAAQATAQSAAADSPSFLEQLVHNAWDPAFNAAYRLPLLGFVALTLATGCTVIPLPEEIAIALAGFTLFMACGGDPATFWLTLALAWLAFSCLDVIGDSILFFIGRRLGHDSLTRWKWTKRVVTPKRLERVQRWFASYGPGAIVLGRQIAGVRMCMFLTAGASRVDWRRFAFFDLCGAMLSVPLWLLLGALAAHPDYGAIWAREAAGRVSNGLALAAVMVGLALLAGAKVASLRAERTTPVSEGV